MDIAAMSIMHAILVHTHRHFCLRFFFLNHGLYVYSALVHTTKIFQSDCTNVLSHRQETKVLVFPHSH